MLGRILFMARRCCNRTSIAPWPLGSCRHLGVVETGQTPNARADTFPRQST